MSRRGIAMTVLTVAAFMDLRRRHDRQRRVAGHAVRPRRDTGPARVGPRRLHARRSRSCSSPAGGSATCSADARVRRRRHRIHARLARRRPGRPMPTCSSRPGSCRARFAAMMVPQLLSTIQVLYAPKERADIFGMVGAVSGTAAVVGPCSVAGWSRATCSASAGARSSSSTCRSASCSTVMALSSCPTPVGAIGAPRPLRRPAGHHGPAPARLPAVEGRQRGWPGWVWAMFVASAVVLVAFVAPAAATGNDARIVAAADAPVRQPRLLGRPGGAGDVPAAMVGFDARAR